jgi:hypothetical protein
VTGQTVRRRVALVGLLISVLGYAEESKELVVGEIQSLLTRLESSNCRFNRNGVWYSATDARRHLERKLESTGSLRSAEQFVERIASKSSMTGEPYLVSCDDVVPVRSRDWLLAQLREIRADSRDAVQQDEPGSRQP